MPPPRRNITPGEVQRHHTQDDCWVSVHGRVLDVSPLINASPDAPQAAQLVRAAGGDISHWFEKANDDMVLKAEYDVSPDNPPSPLDGSEVWWQRAQYDVGALTARPRMVRVVNTLNLAVTNLEVCAEDTVEAIQDRYNREVGGTGTHVWRVGEGADAPALAMAKTLEENNVPAIDGSDDGDDNDDRDSVDAEEDLGLIASSPRRSHLLTLSIAPAGTLGSTSPYYAPGAGYTPKSPRTAPMYLYISHFLSAFIDRTWQFAVPVLLMLVWTDTLLPAAVVGFASNFATFVLMPYVGHWTDQKDRLRVLRFSIVMECLSCLAGAFLLYYLTVSAAARGETRYPTWGTSEVIVFALLCCSNAAAEVTMRVGQQSLEKDWVVVVAQSLKTEVSEYNTRMRMIDLSCKLLGPFFFGLVVQATSYDGISPVDHVFRCAGALALVALVAAPVEFVTVAIAYCSVPSLSVKLRKVKDITTPFAILADGWRLYLSHPVLAPSFAYCCLWFTVLDNGTLMTAYLQWQGVEEGLLGGSRGAGAMMGMLGTTLYPFALRWCGGDVNVLGKRSLWVFFAHLVPVGVAFAMFGVSWWSSAAMLLAVTLSRGMLWIFDLATQQILQDNIHEAERGVINGVHTAMCQLMLIFVGIAGMVVSDPRSFPVLVCVSLGSVGCACLIFTRWERGYQRAELQVADAFDV